MLQNAVMMKRAQMMHPKLHIMMIVFASGYLNCTICLNSCSFLWQKSTIRWYFKYLKDKKNLF